MAKMSEASSIALPSVPTRVEIAPRRFIATYKHVDDMFASDNAIVTIINR
jgi:hypothetical protein